MVPGAAETLKSLVVGTEGVCVLDGRVLGASGFLSPGPGRGLPSAERSPLPPALGSTPVLSADQRDLGPGAPRAHLAYHSLLLAARGTKVVLDSASKCCKSPGSDAKLW